MVGNPHVLVVPHPSQGHVLPLMELSLYLIENGAKVTFVNTDFSHKRVIKALADSGSGIGEEIRLVSLPDGLEPKEDRNNFGRLNEGILNVMPGKLEELIRNINNSENDEITCVIADTLMVWALGVAKKMDIRTVAFWPAAIGRLALVLGIPKLIDEGVLDEIGTPLKTGMIKFSPHLPAVDPTNFFWASMESLEAQKIIFDMFIEMCGFLKVVDKLIGNSTYDLEPAAFSLVPDLLPIGPLLASNRMGSSVGSFWPEDPTCLNWLDQQETSSVIYVAFGSITVFDKTQFQELALGLELTNRPFLWVVRPDITEASAEAYPDGFLERVANRGKIVSWAPQQKVLSHPATTCFLSHCGWNSTMEGVSNGLPFLCWPYFADQMFNETYICDFWKIGLGFDKDANGIITSNEIASKVEQLIGSRSYKEKVIELKDKTVSSMKEGGRSYENFRTFIEWLKT